MIIRSFICPNCLTEFPVTLDLQLALGEMELIQDKYSPTVCPMCGVMILLDSEYKPQIINTPIAMSLDMALSLNVMRQYVLQMDLSKYKQPWNN